MTKHYTSPATAPPSDRISNAIWEMGTAAHDLHASGADRALLLKLDRAMQLAQDVLAKLNKQATTNQGA